MEIGKGTFMQKIEFAGGYKIGHVTVDLSAYTGADSYSDGDIENEILEIVKTDRIEQALREDSRWPVLYHLAPERENLLSWMPISKTESVLEIGMGCGGVTGVFCRKAASVETVEISPRRAEIASYRHRFCKNLRIHVGNLNDMKFTEKFDYVTLIGVLEYAGEFTHTRCPFQDFLRKCKSYLKMGGKLVIAIENRLGLKYWSGSREDHTGGLFEGIVGYDSRHGIRTFSKKGLVKLLEQSGFKRLEWYYPFPDYKIPFHIFSDSYPPPPKLFQKWDMDPFDRDQYELFSEWEAFQCIAEDGLFDIFSNSFLVLASEV